MERGPGEGEIKGGVRGGGGGDIGPCIALVGMVTLLRLVKMEMK